MKELLVIDTNILSHALTPNQTAAYASLFAQLEQTYRFVVTGYTQYELLCSSDIIHIEKIHRYVAENMVYVELSQILMDFAAKLRYLYSKEIPDRNKGISHCDTINAALCLAKECPLLTIDNTDYPRPFFVDQNRYRLKYISKQKREVTDTVYMLTPDCENALILAQKHGVKV
jgi:predicted nucleic acid-binding protein